uniref:Uncharacterized protein n=1 Tax=Anguilla anguilla TaxID=7936 RepID=A0A0E9SAZ2_ANGAN
MSIGAFFTMRMWLISRYHCTCVSLIDIRMC